MLAKAALTAAIRRPATLSKALPIASPSACLLRPMSTAAVPDHKQDVKDVMATTEKWIKTVTGQKPTSPAETAALYAKDGVLWATVSTELRVTPTEIRDYFNVFAALPDLKVYDYKPYVRMYGDIAINDGYYTVSFSSPEGTKVTKARYVFVYKRAGNGKWEIVDHHSSAMPVAPAGLKPATTVAPPTK